VGELRLEARLAAELRGPAETRGETADRAVVPLRTAETAALGGGELEEPVETTLRVMGARVAVEG